MGTVKVNCLKCGGFLVEYETDEKNNITGMGLSRAGFHVKAISSDADSTATLVCRSGGETSLNLVRRSNKTQRLDN